MSALPPKADMCAATRHVRLGHKRTFRSAIVTKVDRAAHLFLFAWLLYARIDLKLRLSSNCYGEQPQWLRKPSDALNECPGPNFIWRSYGNTQGISCPSKRFQD